MILITQPRVGKSHNEILALHYAAESLGWEVYPADGSWRLSEELIASGKVGVPYGSWTFCEVIAQQMGWELKRNTFDWLAKLPIKYTKRKVEFMTLAEAKKITERKFIKPADDKCFDAKVYEPGTFNPAAIIEDNYPTLVSDPVEFTMEYRCFTDGWTAKTWSNYIYHEHLADPKYWDAVPATAECLPHEFLNKCLQDISTEWDNGGGNPVSMLKIPGTVPSVVDVGFIPGKGWAIIETNEAYASGLYGCDPVEAIQVMKAACQRTST
jgi:hypothetical protein